MPFKYRYDAIESYTILFCLYFVQGIPYGFQKDFLPIYLRISGYSLTKVGLLRLVWFPWLLKSLWSPWIDKISTPDKWLTVLLTLMACNAWICHMIPSASVQLFIIFLTLLNFLTSLQDVAVDGITVASLSYTQLGAGNIAQIIGYKLGGLFASVVMIKLGWNTFFEILTMIYLFFGVYSYFRLGSILYIKSKTFVDGSYEAEQIHDNPTSQIRSKIDKLMNDIFQKFCLFKCSYKEVFLSVFQTEGATWMLLFVISYKLGEQAMLSIFPLYLIDSGLSTEFIGFEIRIAQEIFSVIGSLYGGWLAIRSNRSLVEVTLNYVCLRMLPVTLITLVPYGTKTLLRFKLFGVASALLMCGLQLISGIITSLAFTMMMQNAKKSPGQFYASHYSILATAELCGKLLIISFAGFIVDVVGYQIFFILCFIACLLVFPMMSFGQSYTCEHIYDKKS